MFNKQRFISTPNYGVPNDPYFAGYSYGAFTTPELYNAEAQFAEMLYRYEYRNGTTALPYFYGSEVFFGTTNRRPNVNFVTHAKEGVVSSKLHSRAFFGPLWGSTIMMCEPCFRQSVNNPLSVAGLPGYGDVDSARRRAYWTMRPQFTGETSLINSILELKDFKHGLLQLNSLFSKKGIDKVANVVRDLGMKTRKAKDRTNDRAIALANSIIELGRPTRSTELAANVILTTNLTVRPLLKDISEIMVQLQKTAADAAAEFQQNGLQPHSTHYTETLISDTDLTKVLYYPVLGTLTRTKFVATMERTYSYRPMSAYNTFMTYWGLGVEWDSIWNAIPFSFVADYFFTIGKSIKRMQVDKNVDLNVRNYYESVLRESTAGYYLYHDDCYYMPWPSRERTRCYTPKFISGYTTSHYERYQAAYDFGAALPKARNLSSNQKLNLLALARVFV